MDSATTFPPEESPKTLQALARNTAMTVPIVVMIASSKVHANSARFFSNPTATEAKQKIEQMLKDSISPQSLEQDLEILEKALECRKADIEKAQDTGKEYFMKLLGDLQEAAKDLEFINSKTLKDISSKTVLVDAIFGIGGRINLGSELEEIISRCNRFESKVAIDVPTGLDCNSGEISQACFNADKTITFIGYKLGQRINEGKNYCGELILLSLIHISEPTRLLSMGVARVCL